MIITLTGAQFEPPLRNNGCESRFMVYQRHKERLDKFSLEVKGTQFVTPYFKDKKYEQGSVKC